MFSNLGTGEIFIIILVIVFLFGGKKMPEIARDLGKSGNELKKAKDQLDQTINQIKKDTFSEIEKQSEGGDQT
ncbi:hypothetical protein A2572_03405 [Candidatus Collierbacteria bacterium RIFOXYD1_FULL_40_9]|uniref:Sec-independent protein translocase protein TatA n=1 Tax=Candidatus Collierbacteria bacterium RIFOXYD1_FULL_40_9 TaxID=1817731 RepID=A0A1F5FX45_9BACT|nr:MAG: hypothetical protein A2572_03405 [Candidatus Collierbacteria bacterium RIFOXYD1_FULL_40_9]